MFCLEPERVRYGIISDIHANEAAFERVLRTLSDIDRIACLAEISQMDFFSTARAARWHDGTLTRSLVQRIIPVVARFN